MVKTKVYIKPNMSETTSYIKFGVIVDIIMLILNIHLRSFFQHVGFK